MYTLDLRDERLTILWQGATVVGGIAPVLTLDDGGVVRPSLTDRAAVPGEDALGPYTDYRFTYQDEGATLALTLSFRVYAEVLVASAGLRALKGDRIGVRARGLAPFGGLRLTVTTLGRVEGLMANYLHKDWWSRPHFDPDPAKLPPRTQSVVWRTAEAYHHLLCVAGDALKTELSGGEDGLGVLTAAYAGGLCNFETVTFVLASGGDPFDLPDRNAAAGMAALGTPLQLREWKRYPEPLEYLGWCSWDAFYREVSADGLVEKARELQEKGVPIRWFIVDDGWMTEEGTALAGFDGDPAKFPGGLAPVVQALKRGYGIWWVGVWHTLFGYWNGIHRDSDLALAYAQWLHTTRTGKVVPAADVPAAFAFWNAWHTYLRRAGVDFVKVDYQSGLLTYWAHEQAIGAVAGAAHEALEASVGKAFDNAMINCMGMATENLWHRPTSAVTRNSDDFFPKQKGSFTEHALQNAYNAYYHAPFMWLDWDMWWTEHEHAATHAVLRAVSGGPIYVSDPPGRTDPERLWPLMLSDGRLLRCDQPGMVTGDCLFVDPSQTPVPLKIWNRAGAAGIVAAVNVHLGEAVVEGSVGPGDVPGLLGERFVVYETFTQAARVVAADERLPLTLAPDGAALFIIVPAADRVTPIGLVNKAIAPVAVADWTVTHDRTLVVLLEGGRFAWAAPAPPAEVRVNGLLAEVQAGDGIYTVACGEVEGTVWVEIVDG